MLHLQFFHPSLQLNDGPFSELVNIIVLLNFIPKPIRQEEMLKSTLTAGQPTDTTNDGCQKITVSVMVMCEELLQQHAAAFESASGEVAKRR